VSASATVSVSATASAPVAPVVPTLIDAATARRCTVTYNCGLSHPNLGSTSNTTSVDLATCTKTVASSSGKWEDPPDLRKSTSNKSTLPAAKCDRVRDILSTITAADARAASESARMDSMACSISATCPPDTKPKLDVQRQTSSGVTPVETLIRAVLQP
jgi:hypothetical protein